MAITNGYCTLADMKTQLGLASGDTAEDAYIEELVEVTSRELDRWCGQMFYAVASETRYYTSHDGSHVYTDPIRAVSSLTTDDTDDGTYDVTWATTGSSNRYRLRPVNSSNESEPFWQLYAVTDAWPTTDAAIKVTATFGWASVPRPIHHATMLQCARLFHRRAAPFGIIESNDAGMMTLRKIDPDVAKELDTYRRPATIFA